MAVSQQAGSMLRTGIRMIYGTGHWWIIYNKEEKAAALLRHVTLFNTEAQSPVQSVMIIICGLEEANTNGQCTPELVNP